MGLHRLARGRSCERLSVCSSKEFVFSPVDIMKPLANFKQVNDTTRLGHRIRRDGRVNMHPCIVRAHRGGWSYRNCCHAPGVGVGEEKRVKDRARQRVVEF